MRPATAERMLRGVLRVTALACALALLAVFMPRSWHEACHRALGMGAFPAAPVAEYLARSLSAMYALLGGLIWMVAEDLRRYRLLAGALAVVCVVTGPLFVLMDWCAGMPGWWTIGEGPFVALYGAVILWLWRRASGGWVEPAGRAGNS